MSGLAAASGACFAVLLATLVAVVWDARSARRRTQAVDAALLACRLDLDAARERVAELQTYLAAHDSWQAEPQRPVPPRVADTSMPDRWAQAAVPPDDASHPLPS